MGVRKYSEFWWGLLKKVGVEMVANFRWGLSYVGGGDFFQVGVEGVLPTIANGRKRPSSAHFHKQFSLVNFIGIISGNVVRK